MQPEIARAESARIDGSATRNEAEMDDETKDTGEADQTASAGDAEPQATDADAPADRPRHSSSSRPIRPWEALEQLDRQWADPTPLRDLPEPILALALTTTDDPFGWDYLGAISGALPHEVGEACAAWLEAQLAADVTMLGRRFRPTVELVPAGRLWYVVRSVGEFICVVDGPGFPSALTAAIAASRRYQAELRRDHDPDKGRDPDPTPAVDTDAPVEAAPEGVETEAADRSPADAEGR